MKSRILLQLNTVFDRAFRQASGMADCIAIVKLATRPEFGDYQANGAMAVAKKLNKPPREFAQQVVDQLESSALVERVEIAGPGFINIYLANDWVSQQLVLSANDVRLGVATVSSPQTIVVDYSAPNLAKEMHVGHLRSTIIGDAVVRSLAFLGHHVIRHNHVGDWGTQFGMLIAYIDRLDHDDDSDLTMALNDLEVFYRDAKKLFDADANFAEQARLAVVKLQGGDVRYLAAWQRFIDISMQHCERVYQRLGVTLVRDDVRAESAYNDDLPVVLDELDAKGLLTQSQNAQCVFLTAFKGKDGQPLPVIVQKSDGGYLYATTDLAAIRYRANELNADRILYFVDARQSLHLQQVFAVAKVAGFMPETCSCEHHPFGMMMGNDGKPFKTRTGGVVKLTDLLDEAEQRALAVVTEKNPDLLEQRRREIAAVVGISAVKYADLAKNRIGDYVFNWDTMLALEGNTAPYLLYAYARIQSIFRKGDIDIESIGDQVSISVQLVDERQLAVKLLQFADTVDAVAKECMPHGLCHYLYELAATFNRFFETCPVLKADEPIRTRRLLFCKVTAQTLKTGLGLLGIQTIEQM